MTQGGGHTSPGLKEVASHQLDFTDSARVAEVRHGMHARMMMVFRMIILAEQGIILSLRMIRGAIILISSR